jgi:serpin B
VAIMSLWFAVAVESGCGTDPQIVLTRFASVPAKVAPARLGPAKPVPVALPPPHRPVVPANGDPSPIVKANNAVAFELYTQLRSQPGNLLIAPAPLTVGLCMLRAGAKGESAAEIDRLLNRQGDFEPLPLHWKHSLAALCSSLNGDSQPQRFAERRSQTQIYQIRLADSLWIQKGYAIRDEYQSLLADQFGIEDMHVDFRGDPVSACRRINQWTAAQTGGRITEVIFPESIPPPTKLVMSICLYLRANWRMPFCEESTQNQLFRISRTEGKQVPMMQMHSYTSDFAYWEDRAMQILEMSSAGGEFGFMILLPKSADGLDRMERSIRPEVIDTFIKAKRTPEEMDVQLPRFRSNNRFSLRDSLGRLGVRQAFDGRRADFSGINGKSSDLFLCDVIHAAMIDINEKGLEAAAAVEYISADSFGDVPVSFHADHPFVFLVRDNRTGCILFLGRLADPTPSAGADGG